MGAALNFGNILKIGIWCSDVEQASVNTVWYLVNSVGGSPATDEDAVATFSATIAAEMKALLANGATFDGCSLRIANVIPFPAVVLSNSGAGAGTAGVVGLPRQTSGLVGFRTNFGGPGYRGRLYLPFPSASDNFAGGTPTAGYKTKLDNFNTALSGFTSISVGGRTAVVSHVVYHQTGPGSPTTVDVAEYQSAGKWATIKKRGAFGRPNTSPFF